MRGDGSYEEKDYRFVSYPDTDSKCFCEHGKVECS